MVKTLAKIITAGALVVGSAIGIGTWTYCDRRIREELSKIPEVSLVYTDPCGDSEIRGMEKLSQNSQTYIKRLKNVNNYAGLFGILGLGATAVAGTLAFGGVLEDEKNQSSGAPQ